MDVDYEEINIVKEFKNLAMIDNSSRDERKVADYLTEQLKMLGCDVYEDDVAKDVGGNTGNIHARLKGTKEGSVLFMAHMDRVQNGIGIKPVIKDGKMYSDGSTILAADDLSGVVAILDGLRKIKESGNEHTDIEIIFSVCEEVGLQGSLYIKCDDIKSKFGYVLDSPGRIGRILDSAMGKAQMYLHVKGKSAHAAYPELGNSALRAAILTLSQIEDGRVDDETVINWSYLVSETPFNAISDKAEAKGLAMSRDNFKLQAYLDKYVKTAAEISKQTGTDIEAEYHIDYPSFYVKEGNSIDYAVKALKRIGVTPSIEHGAGGFDANRMNGYGIEMIGLSTGYSKNHTVNEVLELKDFVKSGELVEAIINEYSDN